MDIESYRDLRLLAEIAADTSVTQRRLAQRHGLALGLMNVLIRRLVTKGYVKVVTMTHNRLQYMLTNEGVAAKGRLSHDYLEYSLQFYRQIRKLLTRILAEAERTGGKNLLLYGTGETSEIVTLVAQEQGFNVVAVIDDGSNGSHATFAGRPVKQLADALSERFDWVIVTSLKGRQQALDALRGFGVPANKVIGITEEHAPLFDAADLRTSTGRPRKAVAAAVGAPAAAGSR